MRLTSDVSTPQNHDTYGGDQRHPGPSWMDMPLTYLKSSCLEFCSLQVRTAGPSQAFLVAQGSWGTDAALAAQAAYGAIAEVLRDRDLTVVHERLFGSLAVKDAVLAARAEALRAGNISPEGPLTFIQGRPPWGVGLAGVIIRAVSCRHSKDRVWTIRDQGSAVGRCWRQGDATHLVLQNLQGMAGPGNGANARSHQARRLIERAAHLLETQGATYKDVLRTWFYLSDILAWYPEFNQARSAIYQELGLMSGTGGGTPQLPASTGIQGEAPGGAACTLDLLAVAGPPESRPLVRQLSNPSQPEALSYGSAFSRGALIRQPDISLIQVSGTAAVNEQGQSLHPGDVRAQIRCTFDKIAKLIGQEGANLKDIVSACVFVKEPVDSLVYQEWGRAVGLEDLPAVVMVADVCRPELLFEVDGEVAFKTGSEDS
jgi:enamine deaminase RidA (YjgF/YER057c/UK114 family)